MGKLVVSYCEKRIESTLMPVATAKGCGAFRARGIVSSKLRKTTDFHATLSGRAAGSIFVGRHISKQMTGGGLADVTELCPCYILKTVNPANGRPSLLGVLIYKYSRSSAETR
jgi:hypothetical protein